MKQLPLQKEKMLVISIFSFANNAMFSKTIFLIVIKTLKHETLFQENKMVMMALYHSTVS